MTFPTPTSLLHHARLAREAMLRRLPAGPAAPPDALDSFARLRDAERYRDSLPVGSAEREGAEDLVRRLRAAHRPAGH